MINVEYNSKKKLVRIIYKKTKYLHEASKALFDDLVPVMQQHGICKSIKGDTVSFLPKDIPTVLGFFESNRSQMEAIDGNDNDIGELEQLAEQLDAADSEGKDEKLVEEIKKRMTANLDEYLKRDDPTVGILPEISSIGKDTGYEVAIKMLQKELLKLSKEIGNAAAPTGRNDHSAASSYDAHHTSKNDNSFWNTSGGGDSSSQTAKADTPLLGEKKDKNTNKLSKGCCSVL